MMEAWQTLKAGDTVRVARGISETEKKLVGRVFTVDRLDETHGYMVVRDAWGSWHVHPEALEVIED